MNRLSHDNWAGATQPQLEGIRSEDDAWYRFIVHKLLIGSETSSGLLQNTVHFITFNYDTSLEMHLEHALGDVASFNKSDVDEFLQTRILHVYGAIKDNHTWLAGLSPTDSVTGLRKHMAALHRLGHSLPGEHYLDHAKERNRMLDAFYAASRGIRTIAPSEKDTDQSMLQSAQKHVHHAEVVYILGYGFDEDNNRRIGLDQIMSPTGPMPSHPVSIMFTNFKDANVINKRVARMLGHSHDAFIGKAIWGTPGSGVYIEKSTRCAYGALSVDFDALEA